MEYRNEMLKRDEARLAEETQKMREREQADKARGKRSNLRSALSKKSIQS